MHQTGGHSITGCFYQGMSKYEYNHSTAHNSNQNLCQIEENIFNPMNIDGVRRSESHKYPLMYLQYSGKL